ncbi:MAG TPA: hypothetical protein VFP58_14650 [Candidatus Eisenbacteria bacterium]|nr:hypothetical protein [Candidatus Eisenbacteria bacterium]
MNRVRALAVTFCGVVFVAGITISVITRYATRVLFDTTTFSNRVAESLEDPRVARVAAGQITDQLVNLRRDLTPYRPLILGTMQQIVSTAPFRAVVRQAARKIHPVLITRGEDLSLTVNDLGLIVREALESNPAIAQKLPESARLFLGSSEKWPTGKILLRVLHLGHRMQRRVLIWLGLGLVAGVAGVLLARRKDRYLFRIGVGLTVTALVVAGIARFGGSILSGLVRSPMMSDLTGGLWTVFLTPLAARMIVLAGLGIVLTASATAVLERIDSAAILRSLWDRVAQRPTHPARLITRGLVLVLFGIVVAFRPSETLEILAVLAGALIFFVGIQDVFVTATRFARKAVPEAASARARGGRSWVPAAVSVTLLAAVLIGAGIFWFARDTGEPALGPQAIVAVNGSPELRDRRLNEVVFPTTHNSMSAASIADWMFANQERGIREQLEDGIRGFLIDIHYGEPVKGRIKTLLEDEGNARKKYEAVLGAEAVDAAMRIRDRLVGEPEGERQIFLAHGFCELGSTPFVEALREMKEFLVTNPNEVLIVIIQDEGVSPPDVAAAFQESGLDEFVYLGPVTPPWPTLGEMVADGGRVVVFAENNVGEIPWYHRTEGVLQETPYGFKTPEAFSNRPNRGGRNGSLLLMNHWIETAPASLPSNAAIVNAYDFLLRRAKDCRRERRMVPNLVAVDFYRTGDLFKVCRALNGVPEPGTEPIASR